MYKCSSCFAKQMWFNELFLNYQKCLQYFIIVHFSAIKNCGITHRICIIMLLAFFSKTFKFINVFSSKCLNDKHTVLYMIYGSIIIKI